MRKAFRWLPAGITVFATACVCYALGVPIPFVPERCDLTIQPNPYFRGCAVSMCRFQGLAVMDSKKFLACGESMETCKGPFTCDCNACELDAGEPDVFADRTVSSMVRSADEKSPSESVSIHYDGGSCSVIYARYADGCSLLILRQREPSWCHRMELPDQHLACGGSTTVCGERFDCDCVDGGLLMPGCVSFSGPPSDSGIPHLSSPDGGD